MKYGLPYKGSKNKIAEWVVSILPSGGTLCDLFCGGCAVTHAAMVSGKYDRFIINDIDPVLPGAFVKAISGGFADEKRVIDREMFDQLKETDPYVALCWSFGSNAVHYLWNANTEKMKLLACNMIMANTWLERYSCFRKFVRATGGKLPERFDLECFERLKRILALEGHGRLEEHTGDYRDVVIPSDAVIYCDIPYRGVDKYKNPFDHEEFYDWAESRKQAVFISEYAMPEDRFRCIAQRQKTSGFSSLSNSTKTIEKIFIPIHQPYSPPASGLF